MLVSVFQGKVWWWRKACSV